MQYCFLLRKSLDGNVETRSGTVAQMKTWDMTRLIDLPFIQPTRCHINISLLGHMTEHDTIQTAYSQTSDRLLSAMHSLSS